MLAIYFSSPGWLKNFVLLIASMAFYAFDAGPLVWLLIVSIVLNHFVGRAIAGEQVSYGALSSLRQSRSIFPTISGKGAGWRRRVTRLTRVDNILRIRLKDMDALRTQDEM